MQPWQLQGFAQGGARRQLDRSRVPPAVGQMLANLLVDDPRKTITPPFDRLGLVQPDTVTELLQAIAVRVTRRLAAIPHCRRLAPVRLTGDSPLQLPGTGDHVHELATAPAKPPDDRTLVMCESKTHRFKYPLRSGR
jgi:hypothetical protein